MLASPSIIHSAIERLPRRLKKSRHDTDGDPIVVQARYRADEGIAVRTKGEGTVDDIFDPRALERRHALERQLQPVGDAIQIGCKELMSKIERGTGHRPGYAVGLVSASQIPRPSCRVYALPS